MVSGFIPLDDRTSYVLGHYGALLTPQELDAKYCAFLMLGGREPRHAEPARFTADAEARLRDGPHACLRVIAERIARDHRDQIEVNLCKKCGGLCRTPKAQKCFRCGYDWHRRPIRKKWRSTILRIVWWIRDRRR